MSSTYRASPVTLAAPSFRGTATPTTRRLKRSFHVRQIAALRNPSSIQTTAARSHRKSKLLTQPVGHPSKPHAHEQTCWSLRHITSRPYTATPDADTAGPPQ